MAKKYKTAVCPVCGGRHKTRSAMKACEERSKGGPKWKKKNGVWVKA